MSVTRTAKAPGTGVATVVVALGAAYSTVLIGLISALSNGIAASIFGTNDAVMFMLGLLGVAFLVIAMIITTVVITNTFAMVTASRVRTIALYRLLGASSRQERMRVVRDGLRSGILGTAIGAVVGLGAQWALVTAAASAAAEENSRLGNEVVTIDGVVQPAMEPGGFLESLNPLALLPLVAIVLCSCWAAWRGSVRVLAVQPVQALGAAAMQESGLEDAGPVRAGRASRTSRPQTSGRPRIPLAAWMLLGTGTALLLAAVLLGAVTPYAMFVGLVGGTLAVLGFIGASAVIIPAALRAIEFVLPRSFTGTVASRTLQAHPVRTARSALGVTISVAVVVMFVVATASFESAMYASYAGSEVEAEAYSILGTVISVITALIAATGVISAIGLINAVSFAVRLRQRELALTRILGQRRSDVAKTILAESARLSIGAILMGLALGIVFGWVGMQSIIGSVRGLGFVPPVVPWQLLVVLAVLAAVLTVLASIAPIRRSLALAPITAFQEA